MNRQIGLLIFVALLIIAVFLSIKFGGVLKHESIKVTETISVEQDDSNQKPQPVEYAGNTED